VKEKKKNNIGIKFFKYEYHLLHFQNQSLTSEVYSNFLHMVKNVFEFLYTTVHMHNTLEIEYSNEHRLIHYSHLYQWYY